MSGKERSPIKQDLIINGAEEWRAHFGPGMLSEPVRFIPMHMDPYPIMGDFLPEYLADEKILVTNLNGSSIYEYWKDQKARMAGVLFDLNVREVAGAESQWEVWVSPPGEPDIVAESSLIFRSDEFGPKSADKTIIPINQHLIIVGVHHRTSEGIMLVPVEGVAIANPYERTLPTGEPIESQTAGISILDED